MVTKDVLKKLTYTVAKFTKDNKEYVCYLKGVVSPRQVANTFKGADNITIVVKTEVRSISIEELIKHSQLVESKTIN